MLNVQCSPGLTSHELKKDTFKTNEKFVQTFFNSLYLLRLKGYLLMVLFAINSVSIFALANYDPAGLVAFVKFLRLRLTKHQ